MPQPVILYGYNCGIFLTVHEITACVPISEGFPSPINLLCRDGSLALSFVVFLKVRRVGGSVVTVKLKAALIIAPYVCYLPV